MEYERFTIKQDEPFCLLKTMQFDVELTAPADMRVLETNFQVDYDWKLYEEDWFFKVQLMEPDQLEKLMDENQYDKSNKIIRSPGILF